MSDTAVLGFLSSYCRPAGHPSDGTVTPQRGTVEPGSIKDPRPHGRHRTPLQPGAIAEPFPTEPYGTSSSYDTIVDLPLRRFVGEPGEPGAY
jgi:hypothetical protein